MRGVVLCEVETAGPGRRVFIVAAGSPGAAIAADGIPPARGGNHHRSCYRWAGGRAGVRGVGADLVNLQKIVPIVPTTKDTLFSLSIGDDPLHGFFESNDSDDLDVTEVLMGTYAGQS